MDWSNEGYVRVYTRDTKTWIKLGWEGQALIMFLFRRADRAGLLDGVRDADDIAVVLANGMPPDAIERGLKRLLDSNVAAITDNGMVLPNFVEAQSANKSDKARQRESRDQRRKRALSDTVKVTKTVHDVTKPVHDVTKTAHDVTSDSGEANPVTVGHEMSLYALHCNAVLCDAVLCSDCADDTKPADPPKSSYAELVDFYFVEFEKHRNSKPVFGAREGKAVRELLAKLDDNLQRACAAITNALADPWWKSRVTILAISNDPDKFLSLKPGSGGRKYTPPQHNDESNRFVPNRLRLPDEES